MNNLYSQVEEIVRRSGFAGMYVEVPAGQKLVVMQGQTVRMHVAFNYRGRAINVTLRCSIGKRTVGVFDEIAYATKSISLPESSDFVNRTAFADIVTTPVSPGVDYDIEAKISEYMGQTLVKIDNVIDVIGAPEFQSFAIASYEAV